MANLAVKDSTTNLIAGFEGFSSGAFWDYKQWSIGYGSGTMPDGSAVKSGDTVTKAQALAMLKRDVQSFANAVNRAVTSNINQNQFDALVSLSYNIGTGNFASSTLLKKVNANPTDFDAIKTEFNRWVNAGGSVNQGLVNRREKEGNLYASGTLAPTGIVSVLLVVLIAFLIHKFK